jgi:uncharacterized protein
VEPILHLSIPVRDLAESIDFYTEALGCAVGRVQGHDADVWFYGMQVTLHERPDEVVPPESRGVRHFGVTLGADELRSQLERLESRRVTFASRLATDYEGTPREQTKAKIFDPSGNVIELKTYVDPGAALSPPRAPSPRR